MYCAFVEAVELGGIGLKRVVAEHDIVRTAFHVGEVVGDGAMHEARQFGIGREAQGDLASCLGQSLVELLACACGVASDDEAVAVHRFGGDEAEAFVAAGDDERYGTRHQLIDVAAASQKVHEVRQAGIGHLLLHSGIEGGFAIVGAGKDEVMKRMGGVEGEKLTDERLDTLGTDDIAHKEEIGIGREGRGADSAAGIDHTVVDASVLRAEVEVAEDALRDGDVEVAGTVEPFELAAARGDGGEAEVEVHVFADVPYVGDAATARHLPAEGACAAVGVDDVGTEGLDRIHEITPARALVDKRAQQPLEPHEGVARLRIGVEAGKA